MCRGDPRASRRLALLTAWLLPLLPGIGLEANESQTAVTSLRSLVEDSPRRPAVAAVATMKWTGGQESAAEFHGFRHIDEHGSILPVDRQTLFRFASVSKLVVAIGFMRLVEQGLIGLDDDAAPYLGFPLLNPASEQPITPRMLLSHTSSIRDTGGYFLPPDQPIAAFFTPGSEHWHEGSHFDPEHLPGDGYFQYCNLNYGLLGTLIERLSQRRFDHYMHEAVFQPLGLQGGFNPEEFDPGSRQRLSVLYRSRDGEWVVQADDLLQAQADPSASSDISADRFADYETGRNATAFSPQGGLRLSLPDLARVALLMVNDGELDGIRLLKRETVAEMERMHWRFDPAANNGDTYGDTFLAFGLGIHLFTGQRLADGGDMLAPGVGAGWKGHLGEAYGLLSAMLYHPETRRVLIYVVNGTPYDIGAYPGEYSSFYRWEEDVLTTLLREKADPGD